jgi:hypothetical protein
MVEIKWAFSKFQRPESGEAGWMATTRGERAELFSQPRIRFEGETGMFLRVLVLAGLKHVKERLEARWTA